MAVRIVVAFVAGLASVVTPCVLPLVPGYLSAVSSVEADRLGEPGVARRVAVSSIPFFAGFTAIFMLLGAGAGAIGHVIDKSAQLEISGFILIVFGLGFIGLLPLPERLVGVGLLGEARRTGSGALLGAAFATCAAPCIVPVLGAVLVLAGSTTAVLKGALLLFAYSVGLSFGFLLAGVSFAKAMGAFRWLRDRYRLISAASGALLVSLGLLLFFDRFWWLRVAFNRALHVVGLGT
ncbi:MAG TPA: cytochrome c biogenesis protein CcdA [Gaiellaceae bacterium]